jgi:hypothetical protein
MYTAAGKLLLILLISYIKAFFLSSIGVCIWLIFLEISVRHLMKRGVDKNACSLSIFI